MFKKSILLFAALLIYSFCFAELSFRKSSSGADQSLNTNSDVQFNKTSTKKEEVKGTGPAIAKWYSANGHYVALQAPTNPPVDNVYILPDMSINGFFKVINGQIIIDPNVMAGNVSFPDIGNLTINIYTIGTVGAKNFTTWGEGEGKITILDYLGNNWTKIAGNNQTGNFTYFVPPNNGTGFLQHIGGGVLQFNDSFSSSSFHNVLVNDTVSTPPGINLHINNSDGAGLITVNSTNGRVGIQTSDPQNILDVNYFTFDSYTKLASHFDGADNATAYTDPIAGDYTFINGSKLTASQKKFGSSALSLNGINESVTLPDSDDWTFGTGDFTVDFWVNFTDPTVPGGQGFCGQWQNASNYWLMSTLSTSKLRMYFSVGDVTKGYYTSVYPISGSGFHHLAFVRNGTTGYMFFDGISQELVEGSAFGSNDVGDIAAVLDVGKCGISTSVKSYTNGTIDEFRISKGIARWTGNFTLPTRAYPNDPSNSGLCVGTDGNVGIGNATPTNKLDVNGDVGARNYTVKGYSYGKISLSDKDGRNYTVLTGSDFTSNQTINLPIDSSVNGFFKKAGNVTTWNSSISGNDIANLSWAKVDNVPANTTSDQATNTTSAVKFASIYTPMVNLTIGANSNFTADVAQSNSIHVLLASGANNMTISNQLPGQKFVLFIRQPAGGSAGTMTMLNTTVWTNGAAPTLNTTNSAENIIGCGFDNFTSTFYCSY